VHKIRPFFAALPLLAAVAHAQDAPVVQAPAPPAIQVSGFVDWYYEYNFNRPQRYISDGAGGTTLNPIQNNLRNFDFKDNQFALNMAEVVIQKAPAPVGFHVNLAFGKATDYIHAGEPGGADTYKHILQAYLTAPVKAFGKGDTIDVGKFVTSHGAEVIETKDNWNYTRSLLFAWAIPYYHAGLRYNHPIDATSSLTLHLVNGWNNVEDNNTSPSVGFMYTKAFTPKFTWVQNYMGGPEQNKDNKDIRHLIDTVLTYNATDKTSLMLNTDFGFDKVAGQNVKWSGVAGYVRQALTPSTAVVARAEYYDDKDGFTTGTVQKVKEATLTYEWKSTTGLLTRAEFRYDKSNADSFQNHDGTGKDSQATVLLGTVYAF
jgi:hypothetical protein